MNKIIASLLVVTLLAGCAVQGESVKYQAGADTLEVNAKVDGRKFTATVFIDGHVALVHHYPPFVNSRDEQTLQYQGHRVRSVLRIIKGIGNTTAQIFVYIDGGDAVEFFF